MGVLIYLEIHLLPELVGNPRVSEELGTDMVPFLELGLKVWIASGVLLVPWAIKASFGGALV
jgi:hypothetical protein